MSGKSARMSVSWNAGLTRHTFCSGDCLYARYKCKLEMRDRAKRVANPAQCRPFEKRLNKKAQIDAMPSNDAN